VPWACNTYAKRDVECPFWRMDWREGEEGSTSGGGASCQSLPRVPRRVPMTSRVQPIAYQPPATCIGGVTEATWDTSHRFRVGYAAMRAPTNARTVRAIPCPGSHLNAADFPRRSC